MIPGLPKNVVPIVMATKTVDCIFPNDMKESIERQQVWVLPNFAMTDYAAQGKTRLYNVVHLHSCRSHMAYYTALSRSSSTAGTIILQGFEPSKITRGCSGHLRQEFREHELLDDISRLRYEGQLPEEIQGDMRNSLIRSYQNWKGTAYVPNKTDKLLRWSANDPMVLLPVVTDTAWHILDKSKKKSDIKPVSSFVPAKGSTSVIAKHTLSEDEYKSSPVKKKPKQSKGSKSTSKHLLSAAQTSPKKKQKTTNTSQPDLASPLGLKWDGIDYSCAYDAFFGIIYNIWVLDPEKWSMEFDYINEDYLGVLSTGFDLVLQGHASLEDIRDAVRVQLHDLNANKFPMGQTGAGVGDLAFTMLQSDRVIAVSHRDCACGYTEDKTDHDLGYIMYTNNSRTCASTSEWISDIQTNTNRRCPDCTDNMIKHISYTDVPKMIVFEYPNLDIETSHKIRIKIDDQTIVLKLRGIVYHGESHFTSRIISPDGDIWYHDGITTGNTCDYDNHLKTTTDTKLRSYENKALVLAIYAQN